MRPETQIIINGRFSSDGEYKKYRSTQDQIDRNQRDKIIQRQRDERARNEANANGNNQTEAHQ
jgi:hypothetical protein